MISTRRNVRLFISWCLKRWFPCGKQGDGFWRNFHCFCLLRLYFFRWFSHSFYGARCCSQFPLENERKLVSSRAVFAPVEPKAHRYVMAQKPTRMRSLRTELISRIITSICFEWGAISFEVRSLIHFQKHALCTPSLQNHTLMFVYRDVKVWIKTAYQSLWTKETS